MCAWKPVFVPQGIGVSQGGVHDAAFAVFVAPAHGVIVIFAVAFFQIYGFVVDPHQDMGFVAVVIF